MANGIYLNSADRWENLYASSLRLAKGCLYFETVRDKLTNLD